jgi:hypothetical protein
MIEIIGSSIYAPETEDRVLCQIAAEASSESKPLMPLSHVDQFFVADGQWTPRVIRGLARISLKEPDYDYSGLSQAKADYIIGELSGSVDDFIYETLDSCV